MPLLTLGRDYYSGYELPVCVLEGKPLAETAAARGQRFQMLLITRGAGILSLGQQMESFVAPALICLSEDEQPVLEETVPLHAQTLCFQPQTVNICFSFERLRQPEQGYTPTELQDFFMLRPFLTRSPHYNGILYPGPATARHFSDLLHSLEAELTTQRDTYWPCRSRSYMIELLYATTRLFTQPQDSLAQTNAHQLKTAPGEIRPVLEYMHRNYREKVSVEELTLRFHTNRTTLTRQFREVTGDPVITYLKRLRVSVAAALLRDTTLPVLEVAARVGYTDLTNFGRLFKRYTGLTPSAYRERHCWM